MAVPTGEDLRAKWNNVRNWALNETQEVQTTYKEKLFHYEDIQEVEQISYRGFVALHFGGFQDLTE